MCSWEREAQQQKTAATDHCRSIANDKNEKNRKQRLQ